MDKVTGHVIDNVYWLLIIIACIIINQILNQDKSLGFLKLVVCFISSSKSNRQEIPTIIVSDLNDDR